MTAPSIDLSGKKALITGASRGIGAEVAKAYARAGAHVILVARTVGGLEALDDEIRAAGGTATLMPLDLGKLDDIDRLGPTLATRFGGLDILVANAGMLGTLAPVAHGTAMDWNKVLSLNYGANFRLIRTLDPMLRAAPAGRAIFTSSGLGERPLAYWGPYCVSKAALNMLAQVYAAETQKTNLRVNLVDPGTVDTAMLREAFPGGYQGETRKPADVTGVYLALAADACPHHGEILRASDFC